MPIAPVPSALCVMAACLLSAAAPVPDRPTSAARVDPARIVDMDFERHRDPSNWRGLTVDQIAVRDGDVGWRMWRIAKAGKRGGPLWVVPHDNENAAFAAGLLAVKRWGGVLIAVDSGNDDTDRGARYVRSDAGDRIDPNRSFTGAFPNYVGAALADLGRSGRPIIALHTNSAGFDVSLATCGNPVADTGGSGDVSALLCNDTYTPYPSPSGEWPWDDPDSVVIAPYLATSDPVAGWCVKQLKRGEFNLNLERVGDGDGSLSNYAAVRGLPYLNLETRDLGSDPAGITGARDRMIAMIDRVMKRCPKWRPTKPARLLAADGGGKEAR